MKQFFKSYLKLFVVRHKKTIVSLILHALVVNSPWSSGSSFQSTFNKSGLGKLRHDFMRFFTALFWP